MRRLHFLVLVALGIAGIAPKLAWSQATPPVTGGLVRQIDHIMIDSDQPEQLFQLFRDKFELPLGWPYKSYGAFSSGGVGFGNVILETIHLDNEKPGIVGVGFEPNSLPDVVAGLDSGGLKHGSMEPVYQKDSSGNQHLSWTTLDLNLPVGGLFFCKYEVSIEPRRARIQKELAAHDGGPLGIESVTEIVIGVRDMVAAQRDFRSLLGVPRSSKEAIWTVGSGPAVHLKAGTEDHLALVRIKVKSLERAREFLKHENLLGEDTGREISLARSRLGETSIQFAE